ncbi:hypothetical protein H2198_009025 [Neophaeococcomyces mojaviensis]|uniref:Uncharacterized protein n=1 Tax=Neophaeococcomyces mojaviensis TaxID=3383035 RepID=A0ACC2ZVM2_9EURO|nr:hypothetical protein H2198_009025 [Knufia sp. JES_112]
MDAVTDLCTRLGIYDRMSCQKCMGTTVKGGLCGYGTKGKRPSALRTLNKIIHRFRTCTEVAALLESLAMDLLCKLHQDQAYSKAIEWNNNLTYSNVPRSRARQQHTTASAKQAARRSYTLPVYMPPSQVTTESFSNASLIEEISSCLNSQGRGDQIQLESRLLSLYTCLTEFVAPNQKLTVDESTVRDRQSLSRTARSSVLTVDQEATPGLLTPPQSPILNPTKTDDIAEPGARPPTEVEEYSASPSGTQIQEIQCSTAFSAADTYCDSTTQIEGQSQPARAEAGTQIFDMEGSPFAVSIQSAKMEQAVSFSMLEQTIVPFLVLTQDLRKGLSLASLKLTKKTEEQHKIQEQPWLCAPCVRVNSLSYLD